MTATPAGMSYADYLHLDTLLSAQHPLSDLHDEMLFVIIHQAKELWLKQMLHEVGLACRLVREDRFAEAYKALSRVSRIWTVMTLSRDVLGSSSGFQSAQFRELEFRLGIKDPKFLDFHEGGSEGHARLTKALAEPSLWEEATAALTRAGFSVDGEEALKDAWLQVYRNPEQYFGLYQLAEKLVDLDDALAAWRHKHMLTVDRIIGMKKGTGGSAGVAYLASTLTKRAFPELWALRTEL